MKPMFGFVLVIFVGLMIFLWRQLAVKELALAAAKKHCLSMGVQFLDGSVVQDQFRIVRNRAGHPAILQSFQFEFSTTGEKRYLGWTEFSGRRMLSITLQPHAMPDQLQ